MCHVLVIEDEPIVAEYVGALAQEAGATTLAFARSEREAVAAAKLQRPDFILSDVRLLEGTGPRAVRTILENFGPVPVIFITGTPTECECCGWPAEIMTKPLVPKAFIALFRNILHQAPGISGRSPSRR